MQVALDGRSGEGIAIPIEQRIVILEKNQPWMAGGGATGQIKRGELGIDALIFYHGTQAAEVQIDHGAHLGIFRRGLIGATRVFPQIAVKCARQIGQRCRPPWIIILVAIAATRSTPIERQ